MANVFGDSNSNVIDGTPDADVIFGREGDDTINAGDNPGPIVDALIGGPGDDLLNGGNGFDYALFDDAQGPVTASLAAGFGGGPGVGQDTFQSIEGLGGGAYGDSLAGDSNNNGLGGVGGDDTLNGAGGNDTLLGGVGNDYLIGGDGIDIADYSRATSGVSVSLELQGAAQSVSPGEADTLVSIEGFFGSSFNDVLTGSANPNTYTESFRPGGGDDTVDGKGGIDVVDYQASADAITFDLGKDTAQFVSASQGTDTVKNVELVNGSNFNDSLKGPGVGAEFSALAGAGGNDTLTGGGGARTQMFGGGGDDFLIGGSATDFAAYNSLLTGASGVRVSLAIVGPQNLGPEFGIDTLVNIKGLIGSPNKDTLTGENSANELRGAAGDDLLVGAGGDDTLIGGDGFDTAKFSGRVSDYAFDTASDGSLIVQDLRSGSPDGTDRLSAVESLSFVGGTADISALSAPRVVAPSSGSGLITGGLGADRLAGGSGSDTVSAGAGADTVAAGTGADVVDGGSGDDTVDGSSGADGLSGGSGADSLSGGSGADTLAGGAGDDTLSGSSGSDLFVFAAGGGHDRINDFRLGDHLALQGGVTLVSFHAVAGGTELEFSDGGSVLLAGVVGLSNADIDNLF